MPKKAPLPLEISKCTVHQGTKHEKDRWLLWSRKSYSGKRVQRYFVTKEAAEKVQEELLAQNAARGAAADELSSADRVDAANALKILNRRASLEDAAKAWEEHKAPKHQSVKISEVISEHLANLKRRDNQKSYLRAQEYSLGVFARGHGRSETPFAERDIKEIAWQDLDAWLHNQGWAALNLRNYARDVSMLFNFAVRRELINRNPMKGVTKPKLDTKDPDILSVPQSLALLELSPKWNLRPFIAVGLFAGVRVDELMNLRWEWFAWGQNEIRLPGKFDGRKVTKTGRSRNVTIFPALKAWLRNPPKKGRVVDRRGIRRRREALAKAAEIPKKRNPLRHTYASHHAALFRDPGQLQIELGQNTPSVLFTHYIQAVPKAEAKAFFALRLKRRN